MNRHHPYGGGPHDAGRRGGFSGGPGPDRNHRFEGHPRGRGFGRGRGRGGMGGGGGYNSYDSSPGPYDQGPPQGDMGGGYGAGQDFYHNNGYGGGPNQYNGPPDSDGFDDQGYGNYDEDGPGYGGPGYGARPPKRQRRERDDKVHDSIIEERIQRERPCRTLFIRNIKYETDSNDVRRRFEEHGDIKTFFDLIANRGMVFVTYYDLRAAERARERLQGSEISGRPIDVHYSLPRDDSNGKDVEKSGQQEMQGTLLVTLRNSMSGQPIDDNEVRRKMQQFGDVKSVTPVENGRMDQRYVEFYDIRAAEEAYDRLRHQSLQDGVMDIALGWETNATPQG
ncbi:RNA-binding domain-containing protein [Heliocybe sulcata]|uniref:RNA-binding domain-containing protein n=1 Tax=Heliocybe sulcata TaxID=5364 RepID=A0A5C3NGK0_9AGAM|nr:RNA-binding domain-containing protein [Heliocybe sulcata]